jgi:hypothetical protein
MSSARLAVKTISGIPPSARDTGHTRLASSACAASYRHPCLLCPPGQTLTIQTTAGTHGAGPVTGNPVRFDCPPGSWRRGIRNVTAPSADGRDLAGAKHRQGLAPSRPAAQGDDACLPRPAPCVTVRETAPADRPRVGEAAHSRHRGRRLVDRGVEGMCSRGRLSRIYELAVALLAMSG